MDFFASEGLVKSYAAASLFDASFAGALQPAVAKTQP